MVRLKRGKKKVSVDQLVRDAQRHLDRMEPEAACQLFQRAHMLRPEDTNIMDALADVLIQLGGVEEATNLLMASTNMAPSVNPSKWMYLGQLLEGMEAKQTYEAGIGFMSEEFQQTEPETPQWFILRRQICKAHCSIAELYLTDLCYEENAEETCEAAVQVAFEVDPDSLEALQVKASLRISQQRKGEAAEDIRRVGEHLLEVRNAANDDESPSEEAIMILESLGSEFPVETCKLLVECATENDSLAELASQLVSDLLCEDDDNVELWYLMGVAALASQPPDVETAEQHLQTALEMLTQIHKDCENEGEEFPFEDQLRLVHEHLAIVEQERAKLPPIQEDEGDQYEHEDF